MAAPALSTVETETAPGRATAVVVELVGAELAGDMVGGSVALADDVAAGWTTLHDTANPACQSDVAAGATSASGDDGRCVALSPNEREERGRLREREEGVNPPEGERRQGSMGHGCVELRGREEQKACSKGRAKKGGEGGIIQGGGTCQKASQCEHQK